ncbi:unnamed protein product, partial [Prorocentrum cordatum]
EFILPAGALDFGGRVFVSVNGELTTGTFVGANTDLDEWAGNRQLFLMRGEPRDARTTIWLKGPPSMGDTVSALMSRSPGGFMASHERWLVESRVPAGKRSAHEHRLVSKCPELAASVDGMNLANLTSMEYLNRRRQLLEEAHKTDPDKPNFEGAHHFLGEDDVGAGTLVAPSLRTHVAGEFARDAAIEKERRKAREARCIRRGALSDVNDSLTGLNALHGCERSAVSVPNEAQRQAQRRLLRTARAAGRQPVSLQGVLDPDAALALAQFESLLAEPDVRQCGDIRDLCQYFCLPKISRAEALRAGISLKDLDDSSDFVYPAMKVVATDASPSDMGVTEATVPRDVVSQAGRPARLTVRKRPAGRLEGPPVPLRRPAAAPVPLRRLAAAPGRGKRRPRLQAALAAKRTSPATATSLSACEQAAVGPGARLSYQKYYDAFLAFVGEPAEDLDELEVQVLSMLDTFLDAGCTKADADFLVAPVKDALPKATGPRTLPRVQRALKGYAKKSPPRSRAPVPLEVAAAAISGLLSLGERDAALQVMTMFSTFIQPGALRKVLVKNLLRPTRAGGAMGTWSLLLAPTEGDPLAPLREGGARPRPLTKTGTSDEAVPLDNPQWLGPLLARHAHGRQNHSPLFTTEGGAMAVLFRKVTAVQGLQVKTRGHWSQDSSVKRYAKPGMVEQLLAALSPAARAHGEVQRTRLEDLFAGRARASWPVL